MPGGRADAGGDALDGVRTQQVVHRVPAWPGPLDQVSAGELIDQRPRLPQSGACERGHRVGVDVRTGMQSEQSEPARRVAGEVLAGPREHGTDGGAGVAGHVEQIEAALLVVQVREQVGRCHLRVGGGEFGGDPQRQRQALAALGERDGRRDVRVHARADQGAQQRDRLRHGEHVELDPARTIARHQAGEVVTAGHQDETRRRARKQRAYLVGPVRVVQHHKHPPAGQHRAIARRALGHLTWDVRAVHAEAAQEPGERVGRRDRPLGIVSAKIDVELAIGEPVSDPVRPAHGQRGLAHSGGASDR